MPTAHEHASNAIPTVRGLIDATGDLPVASIDGVPPTGSMWTQRRRRTALFGAHDVLAFLRSAGLRGTVHLQTTTPGSNERLAAAVVHQAGGPAFTIRSHISGYELDINGSRTLLGCERGDAHAAERMREWLAHSHLAQRTGCR